MLCGNGYGHNLSSLLEQKLAEVFGYDKSGTRVKASKPCALALSAGACELTESTQAMVRSVAVFEVA